MYLMPFWKIFSDFSLRVMALEEIMKDFIGSVAVLMMLSTSLVIVWVLPKLRLLSSCTKAWPKPQWSGPQMNWPDNVFPLPNSTPNFNFLTILAVNAFVSLKDDVKGTPQLSKELIMQVRKAIGPFAAPKRVIIVEDLPKTRSGKIMRRILRKILAGEEDQLGDTSTLADPSVVEKIIKTVHEQKKWENEAEGGKKTY